MKKITKDKIIRKLQFLKVKYFRTTFLYPYLYLSYWHYLLYKNNTTSNNTCYYAARPNPGAGIGHQMANWIAGLWYARQFGLKFAYLSFQQNNGITFWGSEKVKRLYPS